jgi:putative spermidine/putrescine transport system permease protein
MTDTTRDLTTIQIRRPRGILAVPRGSLAWLGVVPFFLYTTLFLILPALWLTTDAFRSPTGGYTFHYIQELFQSQYENAFITSIRISLVTALIGGIFGLFVAYAALREDVPRWVRPLLTTYSGVAANFAGVPLAFAFVATLGGAGLVTQFLARFGLNIYSHGFSLYTFTGLTITYVYFQLPLMILIIIPSLEGVKREWREAATNLGATSTQFWRHVGLPILFPSLLGAMVLLFGNAFSAYATPYALTSGSVNLVPILIGNVTSGEVIADPNLGDALALGTIVIISISVVIYALLQRRSDKWLRR